MSRIYSNTNRIKFTDIPEKYAIPRGFRAKQSEVHSAVITYVVDHYKDTKKYRQQVTDALNRLTYCVMQNELPSFDWVSTDPINTMPDIDIDSVEAALEGFYLTPEAIMWDVAPTESSTEVPNNSVQSSSTIASDKNLVSKKSSGKSVSGPTNKNTAKTDDLVRNRPLQQVKASQKRADIKPSTIPTPKEDLYIQPPKCPRFDVSKIWISKVVGGDNLTIYTTLPEIPTRQNEISATTDLNKMTESELMSLYPNHVIHTRAQQLYEQYEGIDYDEDLGCILPVEGFTKDQMIDNIIKYPHLYRLRKVGDDGKLQPFFSTLEVDGKLIPATQVWDTLPESKVIPRDSEFVKDYIIRRYLLERDNGVKHVYNIAGMLEPYLTLFMPAAEYEKRGYQDTLSIVKDCVVSRVHYKQSRNPILRRIQGA